MGLKMRKTRNNRMTAHSANSCCAHHNAHAYKLSPIGFMKKFSNLGRQTHGVTAIEFGFIAPVFFMLVFFAFEYSYYIFKSSQLRTVLHQTNRYIQTGQLNEAGNTEAALKAYICSIAEPLLDCSQIDVDVRPFGRVSEVTFPAISYNSDGRANNFSINLSGTEPILATRMSMAHKFTASFMNEQVGNEDGYALILSESLAILETHLVQPGAYIPSPPVTAAAPAPPPPPPPSNCTWLASLFGLC